MADIPVNVEINLGVNKQSLGQVKRLVNQEIGNVLSEIAVGVDVSKVKKDLTNSLSQIQTKIDLITVDTGAIKEAKKFINAELGTIKLTDITVAKTKIKDIRKQIREAVGTVKIQNLSVSDSAISELKNKVDSATTIVINSAVVSPLAVTNLRKQIDTAVEGVQINNLTFNPTTVTNLRKNVESSLDNISINVKANVEAFHTNIITPTLRSIGAFTASATKLGQVMDSLASETKTHLKQFEGAISEAGTTVRVNTALNKIYGDAISFTIRAQQLLTDANKGLYGSTERLQKGLVDVISQADRLASAFTKLAVEIEPTSGSLGAKSSPAVAQNAAAAAVSQAIVKEVAKVGPAITAEMLKDFQKASGGRDFLRPSRPEFSLRHQGLSSKDLFGDPAASGNKVQALRILNALAAGAGAGGGGSPPKPPAPPGANPPSKGDDEDAKIKALEAEIAIQKQALAKINAMLTQLASTVTKVAQVIQTTPAIAQQVSTRFTVIKTTLDDQINSLVKQQSSLRFTALKLLEEGGSRDKALALIEMANAIQGKINVLAGVQLRAMQAANAKNDIEQQKAIARQTLDIQKQIANEERTILDKMRQRRDNLLGSLKESGKTNATGVLIGDNTRNQIRDSVTVMTKAMDHISVELEKNRTRESALGDALGVLTKIYGEDSAEVQNITRTFIAVRQKTLELVDAESALIQSMRSQVSVLNKTQRVPRAKKGETEDALFGETPTFRKDGSGSDIGSARFQTEQLLIEGNRKLAGARLHEIRGSIDYAQSVRDLISAQKEAAEAVRKSAAQSKKLERDMLLTSVDTQRTIAGLSGLKQPLGSRDGPSKRFDQVMGAVGSRDIEVQAKFIELLQQQGTSLEKSGQLMKQHGGIVGRTTGLVSNLNTQFSEGEKAAFEFGKAAASAAQRFAAWAVPAAIIFRTLGILQESVQQIIRLDTEATKLAFFQPSFFEKTGDSAERFALTVKRVDDSLRQIIDSAKATGLSIQQTSEAFIEIARIGTGQQFGGAAEKVFRDAVTSLVQVESGALSSAEAVVKLNAIINQFDLNPLQDAKLIAAQLFQEAQRSAFSVGELADSVARVGSAFAGLQNLRFDQVLGLIGQGATTTGASVSRLSTALRQLATLAAQNSEELSNFGVSVSTSAGQLSGFDDVLNVLERINQLSGTVFQDQLAGLVADRRNKADIIALARNVEVLRKSIKSGIPDQKVAADAAEAVSQLQLAQAAAAETLTQKIERLKTSMVDLVEKTGIREFVSDLLDFLRRLSSNAQGLIPIMSALGELLKGIAVSKAAQFGGQFLRGALSGRVETKLNQESVGKTEEALAQGRIQEAIFHSLDSQLISKQKAAKFDSANLGIQAERAKGLVGIKKLEDSIITNQSLGAQKLISQAEASKKITEARNSIVKLQDGIDAGYRRELSLQREINAEIRKGIEGRKGALGVLKSFAPQLTGLATVGAVIFADVLANSLTRVNEDAKKALKPVSIGREVGAGILKGMAAGAIVGSAFAPGIGTAIGAGVGGIAGGISGALDASKQNEEISRELERQATIREDSRKAEERQLELIDQQAAARIRTTKDQDAAVNRQLALQVTIQQLQVRINAVGEERAKQLGLINDLQSAQKDIILVQEQLAVREAERTKERVGLEEDLVRIRERGKRIQTALQVVEEARISALERVKDDFGVAKIRVEFNRKQIAPEVATAQQEASRLAIAIARLEREPGRDQEEKRLATDRQRVEEQIVSLRFRLIQEELRGQKEIFKIADDNTKRQLENYKTAASQVASALSTVVSEQNKIAGLIGNSGETALEKLRIETEKQAAQLGAAGLDENVLARRLAQAQGVIAQRAFDEIKQNAEAQLSALRNTPLAPIADLDAEVSRLSTLFSDVNAGLGLFGKEVSDTQKLQAEQSNQEISVFKQRLDQERVLINVRRQALTREIGVINGLIAAKDKERDAIQKRIDKEAEIGREFLATPEKIVSELRNLLLAKSALAKVKGTSQEGFVDDLADRIDKARGQGVAGRAMLQQILEGLQAAEKFNVRLASTLSPQQLTATFSRLLAFQSKAVSGSLGSQKTVQDEIVELRNGIIDRLNKQIAANESEAGLSAAAAQLSREQADSLSLLQTNLLAEFQKANAERTKQETVLKNLEGSIASLGETIPGMTTGLDSLLFTPGDDAIVNAIDGATKALELLVEASPEARELRRRSAEEVNPANVLNSFLEEATGLQSIVAPFEKLVGGFVKFGGASGLEFSGIGKEIADAVGITARDVFNERQNLGSDATVTQAFASVIGKAFDTSAERQANIGKLSADTQKVLLETLIKENSAIRQTSKVNADTLKRGLERGLIGPGGKLDSNALAAIPLEDFREVVERSKVAKQVKEDRLADVAATARSEGKKTLGEAFDVKFFQGLAANEKLIEARQFLSSLEGQEAAEISRLRTTLGRTNPEILNLVLVLEDLQKRSPALAAAVLSANSAIRFTTDSVEEIFETFAKRELARLNSVAETRKFQVASVTPGERVVSEALRGGNGDIEKFLNTVNKISSLPNGPEQGLIIRDIFDKETAGALVGHLQSQLGNENRQLLNELLKSTLVLQNSPLFHQGGDALVNILSRVAETKGQEAVKIPDGLFDPATTVALENMFNVIAGKIKAEDIPRTPVSSNTDRQIEFQKKLNQASTQELIDRVTKDEVEKREIAKGTKAAIEKNTEVISDFKQTLRARRERDERQATAINNNLAPIQIAPEAIELLNTSISESISNSISGFGDTISRLETALTNSQVNVEFGDFNVKLFAEIIAKIEDNGFADALREKLAGTALESQVDSIVLAITDVIKAMESTTPPLLAARTEAIDSILRGKPDQPR